MKIILSYSSNSKNLLYVYKKFLNKLFNFFSLKYLIVNSPQKIKLKTLLKSPHVNKRSKENFKLHIYKFKIYIPFNLKILKLFRFNVPKNIHLKIIYFV
jgi:hypothetical protein